MDVLIKLDSQEIQKLEELSECSVDDEEEIANAIHTLIEIS